MQLSCTSCLLFSICVSTAWKLNKCINELLVLKSYWSTAISYDIRFKHYTAHDNVY